MSDPMTTAKTPDSLQGAAANAMRALSKVGGDGKEYSYRLVRNPDTAAFLVEVKNVFRDAGKYYPPTVRPYAEDARDGYTEEVNYSVWDTRTGELVVRDTVRAPMLEQVITPNVRDCMFWI